jgi:integrase
MPKLIRKQLSVAGVRAERRRGWHADGGGLYLQITETGIKSWLFRYSIGGRARAMGLGSIELTGLAEARERAIQYRQLLLQGIDPLEHRRSAKADARLLAASALTFEECASAYIAAHKAEWRHPKTVQQWTGSLVKHAYQFLGELPVDAVDLPAVLKVLEPIWLTRHATARRVRTRIEAVLDWATVRGYRRGDNPARWRGHLDHLLSAQGKVRRVKHHTALPYADVGAFMSDLRARPETSAMALEFAILTAVRTSEVRGARWSEFDSERRVWTISADRMKGAREHRVPMSDAARSVVLEMEKTRTGEFVFPGNKIGRPLSDMTLLLLSKRMGHGDLTTHGFRSTFRDWAAEMTSFAPQVCEMALAHSIGDKVEAAYRRGDLFEKRRKLMEAWADYCAVERKPGKVVPMWRAGK